jgi:excisionase family DNA binding protein
MKLLPSAAPFDSLVRANANNSPMRRLSSTGSTPSVKKIGSELAGSTRINDGNPRGKDATAKSGSSKSGSSKSAASAVKKRVRLRPETREQLLERLRNPTLSLHEASILLRVSRATVRRYADSGRLPCLRTTGGQRRFTLRDIENFYRQLKLKR